MAVREQAEARPEAIEEGFGASKRLTIGLNVGLSVLLAVGLVVVLNYIASLKHVRADVATFGSYGLSERTRRALDGLKGDVHLTTAYLSTDPDSARERFIDRLVSYGDELGLASKRVQVDHIAREDQKAQLVRRIAETYGNESTEHKKVVSDYADVKKELDQALQFGGSEMAGGEGWLTSFPLYGSILAEFREDRENAGKAADEVTRAAGGTLPNYGDATNKISSSLRPIKDHLTKVQQAMSELARLADEVRKKDSRVAGSLKAAAAELKSVAGPLLKSVGVGGAEPADARAALSAFASEAPKVEEALRKTATRIDAVAREFPAIETHQDWRMAMNMGVVQAEIDPPQLLSMTGRDLRQNRQALLDLVDRNDPAQIAKVLKTLRVQVAPQVQRNLATVSDKLTSVAGMLAAVDPGSAKMVDQARGGRMFAKTIDSLDKLLGRIDKLPPLKLGQIAEDLKRDNLIVVEANKQARVLSFDDVWPVREQNLGGGASAAEARPRGFNGDAAIGGAVVSLTSEKPFATVIFGTFEVQPPPQMRQMMQPQDSSIPGNSLTKIKDRLRAANFAVREWDLAKEAPPPTPEAGTQAIFVFTPPAPPNQPNPFMGGQNTSRTFGPKELKRVEDVLDKGGRAVFLCCWEWRQEMFGGFSTPTYAYASLLKDQWGIEVDNGHRIVEVLPDAKRPASFFLSSDLFFFMGLNQFSDQPVGRAFRNARMFVTDACPVARAASVPAGVEVETVLSAPAGEKFVGAEVREVIRFVSVLRNPDSEQGSIERNNRDLDPPFGVVLAATRKKDGKESRILVHGAGKSVWDHFLPEPIQRTGAGGRLYADPAPTNNADFLINGLHWLRGEEQWIASGPVAAPVIEAIDANKKRLLTVALCGVFPLLVLGVGGLMWWTRQR